MADLDRTEWQLGVIHALKARAVVYRSLSAATALVGGLLSFGGFATAYYAQHSRHHPLTLVEFLIIWLVILALTVMAALIFFLRESQIHGRPLFSPGLGHATACLLPVFCCVAVLTSVTHRPIQLAILWIAFYGLALLATQHFAPGSLRILGLIFLVTGCALVPTWKHFFVPPGRPDPSALVVSGLLAATFGGFHLIYAAAVWALGEGHFKADSPK